MIALRSSASTPLIVGLLIALWLTAHALHAPFQEFGDGREYILQTQALVFDSSVSIDPAKRGHYWNATNPFEITLPLAPSKEPGGPTPRIARQCAPGYGSLYQAKDGEYRFAHTWMYSLVVAPVYAALHALSPGHLEYMAFRLLNVAFLFVPIFMVWRLQPTWWSLAFLTLALMSPLTPHLQWAHSELFCFSTILFSLASVSYPRIRWLGPVALGIGAAQNIPIAFFFPFHLWLTLREEGSRSALCSWKNLTAYALGVAIPLSMMGYYYHFFGTLNLNASTGGADTSVLTLNRLRSVFMSPQIGVVWYFPAAWLGFILGWKRAGRVTSLLCCLSVVVVVALCSTTTNINSAQLSAPRYAVWFLAPLYLLPFLHSKQTEEEPEHNTHKAFALPIAAVIGISLWLHSYQFLGGEWQRFYSTNRANSRVAKMYRFTHFSDDIEPLVENIQGRELTVPHSFNGVYIWNLGASQSMWIISKRAWAKMSALNISGDTNTLERSEALTRLFELQRNESGALHALPRADVTFRSHPYWGEYLLLWVTGDVTSVESSVSVIVKVV